MPRRHAAQLPQGVLQTLAQRLQAFRETDRRRFPVRVRQHRVVGQVRKRLTGNRHTQVAQVREVGRQQVAWPMHLAEIHFFRRPGRSPPRLHSPLQGSQLAVVKSARIVALQPPQQGLGHQPRRLLQLRHDERPHLGERVGPRPPRVRRCHLAGQPQQLPIPSCRLLVHVRLHRRLCQRATPRQPRQQSPHLSIRDHRNPPGFKGLQFSPYRCQPGNLIVANDS